MRTNFAKMSATLGLKFGPVRKGVTPRKILEHIVNDLVMIQADRQMATDPDILRKYAGMIEAYREVAHFIAPFRDVPVRSTAKTAADVIIKSAIK